MFKKMSSPLKAVLCAIVVLAVVGSCVVTAVVTQSNDITHNINSMPQRAQKFYDNGEKEKAFYQMQIYCQERSNDSDAWIKLGDWQMEDGKTDEAVTYYKKAAAISRTKANSADQLTPTITLNTLTDNTAFTITPKVRYTMDMSVTFTGGNLAPEKSFSGKIANNGNLTENSNYQTTDWITINSSKKYISLGGGFNCAIWEFADENKAPLKIINDKSTIRKLGSTTTLPLDNKSYITQEIPKGTSYMRVTYIDSNINNSCTTDDSLVVFYGSVYSGFANTATKTVALPDLKDGQSIRYENGKWTLNENGTSTELDLGTVNATRGTSVSISGKLLGQIVFDSKEKTVTDSKDREYGIRYKLNDGNSLCDRLGDSVGMSFDYTVGDKWVNGTENDFDKAYPWCAIKLCNVSEKKDGGQTVTYEGQKGFALDGSNGNVMVEIPKFYTKREIKNGYEYIWISGERHDGYSLEPAFQGRMGGTFANIYVGAYLSSSDNEKMRSVSNSRPVTNLKVGDIIKQSQAVGFNYGEIDYLTYNAIQKLFLVETATLDSTSLISGACGNYYYSPQDAQRLACAVKDDKSTNSIVLQKSTLTTDRFKVGDTVAILISWDNYSDSTVEQREILKMEDDESSNTCKITFLGTAVTDIIKGKTAITNIARVNGKTDSLKYCTSVEDNGEGKSSFKYRGIENLYGNASTLLDGAYLKDDIFYVRLSSNKILKTELTAPTNEMLSSDYTVIDRLYCIKSMGFDENNPALMLPSAVADDASASNYFGDCWVCGDTAKANLYLTAGGAFSSGKISGLFSMRTSAFDDGLINLGGRLLYR
ncbi:MAG: hypothetical protein IJV39_03205 [Ruminococcus sp.]|nr:hypothetical protein [Ruminococcus sp.]